MSPIFLNAILALLGQTPLHCPRGKWLSLTKIDSVGLLDKDQRFNRKTRPGLLQRLWAVEPELGQRLPTYKQAKEHLK